MINPRFSVIMLVYNTKEEYLRYAISSVLNQTYKNYEFIIIDDGSNQETKNILSDYSNSCIIKHQENIGMPGSRLEGLKIAKGDYVLFVDSDDFIIPESLEIFKNIIEKENVDVVLADYVRFVNTIDNIKVNRKWFNEGILDKMTVLKELCQLHINCTCGRAVKRELFEGMENAIDTRFQVGEDVQQSTYVLLKANSYYYTLADIYLYRIVEEHREYNSIKNINDSNFLTPVYNQLFVEHNEYGSLLPLFKTAAVNADVYNGFRACLWIDNKKEKYDILDQINNLEITKTLLSLKEKTALVSTVLFKLLTDKHYFLFNIAAHLYDLIYGVVKL